MADAQYPAVTVGERELAQARSGTTDGPAFVGPGERADVAVLVVTYNNADDIDQLLDSLRREAVRTRLRVVVADNASVDGTLARAARHDDVIAFSTGGNLGYAAGINLARSRAGEAAALLVLNPDLTVLPGAIEALRRRLTRPGVGAVVPHILDSAGRTYPSLRREPTLMRALGDALMGSRLSGRPHWMSEIDYAATSYRQPHPVDWATGAAVLVAAAAAGDVGNWDEGFFLYSEETDFLRRMRDAGWTVWYEPEATVRHREGGSGRSPSLTALMTVNRVRYAAKHGSRAHARGIRLAVLAGAALRVGQSDQRAALRFLLDRKSWTRLPAAQRTPLPVDPAAFPAGSVVIPAHDEAAVISRTLQPLAALAATGCVEVVVACNGCTDDTSAVARRFEGVTVLDVPEASKVAALNAADRVATRWPRLYLDADIEIAPAALRDLFEALSAEQVLAARPPFVYDVREASFLVRSYYRARTRLPSTSGALWGAGAYAVSHQGRGRFGQFPALTADDLFVDSLFEPDETRVVDTVPVVVRAPRDLTGLLAVLRRTYRGNAELRDGSGVRSTSAGTLKELLRSAGDPVSALDAVTYTSLAVVSRVLWRLSSTTRWERDLSSRHDVPGDPCEWRSDL